MRLEYSFSLNKVEVPCFSVETTEGPRKLFTLTTLILNVLAESHRVDVIFHSPNREDLPKKIQSFYQVLMSAPDAPQIEFVEGESGAMGSSYYKWIRIETGNEKS